MSYNFIKISLVFIFILVFIPCLFIPNLAFSNINIETSNKTKYFNINNSSFCWPSPGYTKITSPFCNRNSPTKHASSFHQGIDIAAPAGTNLVAVANSQVVDLRF